MSGTYGRVERRNGDCRRDIRRLRYLAIEAPISYFPPHTQPSLLTIPAPLDALCTNLRHQNGEDGDHGIRRRSAFLQPIEESAEMLCQDVPYFENKRVGVWNRSCVEKLVCLSYIRADPSLIPWNEMKYINTSMYRLCINPFFHVILFHSRAL